MNLLKTICYLCGDEDKYDNMVPVDLTTGEKVMTHQRCLNKYIESTTNTPSACGSCSSASSCSGSC
ncbi:MAG: hypothetical protein INQ03_03030 [Candidatus Heimdallarchaeota archaeon]|nr:hypothetical protein [Candidatus Heimdallarchaeota archaeon]